MKSEDEEESGKREAIKECVRLRTDFSAAQSREASAFLVCSLPALLFAPFSIPALSQSNCVARICLFTHISSRLRHRPRSDHA